MLPDKAAPSRDGRELERALKQCDAEIRRNPALAEAHVRRGLVLQALQRPGDALQSYDRAIALAPGFAEGHCSRADLMGALGRFDEAIIGYEAATGCRPDFQRAWNNRARALRALRRPEEALLCCDNAVAIYPRDADTHMNRGNVLMELGRPEDALSSYALAVSFQPELAEAHYNWANAAARTGREVDALQGYDRAVALKPGFAEACHARANVLEKLGRFDEALESFERAIVLKPDLAESYNNKGNILNRLGRHAEAVESYTHATRVRPGYALAWSNRAGALKDMGRFPEALESCHRAIALAPGLAAAHFNRGNVLKALKRFEEAGRSFDRAIECAPAFEAAHRNKATTTLLAGDVKQGWRLYERRDTGATAAPLRAGLRWTGGEDLGGKTLLILTEQGFGDTIQFCRYALLAAARGAAVTLAVQDPLVGLFKCLEPAIEISSLGTPFAGRDYYIPLMSMPHAFGTDIDNIPSSVPYLSADPSRVDAWKARIGSGGFRIGIAWQGAPGGEVDIGRSFSVQQFESIAGIPGIRLISLQKNAGIEQLQDLPAGMDVEAFGGMLDPGPEAFVDTAAVMENLDLVISSDTAVAHLAGALGRPVWVALSHVPDWRWRMDREDSPWYPAMKLFRQSQWNDWSGVFGAMKDALMDMLAANRRDL